MGSTDGLLTWKQPGLLGRVYELSRGDAVVGTLRFQSAFGSRATADIDRSSWTFKRMGFLRTRVSIRAADSDEDIAVFLNNTWNGGGTLVFPDGVEYRANTNFWHTQFEFVDRDNRPLIRYHMRERLTLNGDVEVLPAGSQLPCRPWLMMLGWYLAVMMHRDDAAVAASAAVAGSI